MHISLRNHAFPFPGALPLAESQCQFQVLQDSEHDLIHQIPRFRTSFRKGEKSDPQKIFSIFSFPLICASPLFLIWPATLQWSLGISVMLNPILLKPASPLITLLLLQYISTTTSLGVLDPLSQVITLRSLGDRASTHNPVKSDWKHLNSNIW